MMTSKPWIGLLAGTKMAAPPWDEVAQDKEFAFLPPDAPSRRSEELFEKAFPDDRVGSNVVLVLHREASATQGDKENLDRDKKFIEDVLEPGVWGADHARYGRGVPPSP